LDKKYGRVNVDKKQAAEKKEMPAYVKYGIAAVILLAVIVSVTLIWYSAAGSYVATVGDIKIGVKEYKYYLETQKGYMLGLAQSADPNVNPDTFWASDIGGQKAIDIAKKSALEGIRDVKIQLAKAKEAKITLTSEEKKAIDNGIKTNYIDPQGGNRIKANRAFMDEYGFGIDDIKKVQEENYIVQKYQEKVITERNISEDDQKKEFDKDPKKFEEVTVTHVLYLYEGSDGKRSKEDSKKLAEETLEKVKAGENIVELAKKSSEDPGVAQNDGVYTFTKDE
jgi:foldase protein PrsA